MKKIINWFFGIFNLELRRKNSAPVVTSVIHRDSMIASLNRIKSNQIIPAVIIDLGAAAGTWSEKAIKVFKESTILMFEPLKERKEDLQKLSNQNPRMIPVMKAVGDKVGKVNFFVSNDLDGSGITESVNKENLREVELVTLDSEIKNRNLEGPFLLKFDTHGFEIPILNGAREVLKSTEVIIMECYGFKINSNALVFQDMVNYMDTLGFKPADFADILRRPDDKMFWQFDIIFMRKNHPFFESNKYKK